MRHWIFSANFNIFDIAVAIDETGFINWNIFRTTNIEKGDIVYLYLGKPISQVVFQFEVTDNDLSADEAKAEMESYWKVRFAQNKKRWIRMKFLASAAIPEEQLQYATLKEMGFRPSTFPQYLRQELKEYVELHFRSLHQPAPAVEQTFIRNINEYFREERIKANYEAENRNKLTKNNTHKDVLLINTGLAGFVKCSDAIDTMCEVIRSIGFDTVAALNIMVSNRPLLTKTPQHSGYRKENSGWYLLSNFPNVKKVVTLNEIFNRLDLRLVARIDTRQPK